MIEITEDQIDRISLILGGIKGAPNKAMFSVINRGLNTVRSQSSKYIRETYNIMQKDIKSSSNMKMKKANSSDLAGEIEFAGNLIPLIKFNTKGSKKNGVLANVEKGSSFRLKEAYIANLGKYSVGVFERETKKRESSKEVYGPSTSHMMDNENVISKVEKAAQETIDKRVEHEITRILNGYV